VIPRDRRSTSASAASSLSYFHMRVPPSAGPSVVSCTAIMALRPVAWSWTNRTASWLSKSLAEKTDISSSIEKLSKKLPTSYFSDIGENQPETAGFLNFAASFRNSRAQLYKVARAHVETQ